MLIFTKMRLCISSVAVLSLLSAAGVHAAPVDPTTELNAGGAGPADWAVLDAGNFSLSFPAGTGTANGVANTPEGLINGNVGVSGGNVSVAASSAVNGSVYLGSSASGYSGPSPTVTGSGLPGAALTYAFNTVAAYYNSLTPNFTVAPSAGTVPAGVYDLSSWNLNGGSYILLPGQVYVFNVSSSLNPQGGVKIIDSTPGDVIFNVNGSFQTSGGLNQEAMIDGIVLATGQISLTPGYVDGEIISDTSINIASGGTVLANGAVPDVASTLLLLGFSFGGLLVARKKLAF